MPKKDHEQMARNARVKRALKNIQPKHFAWMCDALYAHYRKEIEKSQHELLRFMQYGSIPSYTTREEDDEIQRTQEFLRQYEHILEFVIAARDVIVHISAEMFARKLVTFYRTRK